MKKLIPLLLVFPFLSGCIAWEIRDEIRTANRQLCDVNPSLVHTIHGMEAVNEDIQKTNAQLAQVQVLLDRTNSQLTEVYAALKQTDENLVAVGSTLGQTQPKLTDLDGGLQQMKVINDVHASLKEVNAALGPLGKSLGSLGGAMSFLGMGGDSSTDLLSDEQAAAATSAAGAPAEAATDAADGGAARAATGNVGGGEELKRPEPLLGTWVLVYPPPVSAPAAAASTPVPLPNSRVTVISSDGKFLTAEGGQRPRTGQWSRQGRTLTFKYDATEPKAGEPAGEAPEVQTAELLTLNSRTMTLRRGDLILVHARP